MSASLLSQGLMVPGSRCPGRTSVGDAAPIFAPAPWGPQVTSSELSVWKVQSIAQFNVNVRETPCPRSASACSTVRLNLRSVR